MSPQNKDKSWTYRLGELVRVSAGEKLSCNKLSCERCDKYTDDGNPLIDVIETYMKGTCSNYQKRLMCLLTKQGVGKIHTQEDIFQFVWNNKPLTAQYGSVSQVVYKTKKELNSDWDIGNFRGKGYFLYCVSLDEIIVKV